MGPLPVKAGALARLPSSVFWLIWVVSALCGGATVVVIINSLKGSSGLFSAIYLSPFVFLISCLLVLMPPFVLFRLRSEQKRDYELARERVQPSFESDRFHMIKSMRGDSYGASLADPKGYYALLGLDRSANPDVVKAAYRALIKHYHPDTNPAGDANTSWFCQINDAYQVLGNPEQRAAYDRLTEGGNAVVLMTPNLNEVGRTVPPPWDSQAEEHAISRHSRKRGGLALLGLGVVGAVGMAGVGAFLGNRYSAPAERESAPPPVTKLCIAPIDGPTEVFSTIPTLQLDNYVTKLKNGTGGFNFQIDGTEAAAQLGFNRRFSIAYGEVIERAKAVMAKNGTETIYETIAFFEQIVITHPVWAGRGAVTWAAGGARASRMAVRALRLLRRPVSTIEQRAA